MFFIILFLSFSDLQFFFLKDYAILVAETLHGKFVGNT